MSKKVVSVVLVVLVLVGAGFWYTNQVSPTAFALASGENVSSWNYKGDYSGNAVLEQQAKSDIATTTPKLGKGEFDDYDLYVGIGNDYAHLGEGKKAYTAYQKAIAIHPTKGLAYINLAYLLKSVGANASAKLAAAKATEVEPAQMPYHIARVDFLTKQFPEDTAAITAALSDAEKQFGDSLELLQLKAAWLTDTGKYNDAIAVWKTALRIAPASRTASINAEIARLMKKAHE